MFLNLHLENYYCSKLLLQIEVSQRYHSTVVDDIAKGIKAMKIRKENSLEMIERLNLSNEYKHIVFDLFFLRLSFARFMCMRRQQQQSAVSRVIHLTMAECL